MGNLAGLSSVGETTCAAEQQPQIDNIRQVQGLPTFFGSAKSGQFFI
jgi:hypothetical protein